MEEAIDLGVARLLGRPIEMRIQGGWNNLYHMKATGWEFIGAVDTNDLYYEHVHPVAHPRAAAEADAVERAPLSLVRRPSRARRCVRPRGFACVRRGGASSQRRRRGGARDGRPRGLASRGRKGRGEKGT